MYQTHYARASGTDDAVAKLEYVNEPASALQPCAEHKRHYCIGQTANTPQRLSSRWYAMFAKTHKQSYTSMFMYDRHLNK